MSMSKNLNPILSHTHHALFIALSVSLVHIRKARCTCMTNTVFFTRIKRDFCGIWTNRKEV